MHKTDSNAELITILKKFAPYSVIERGTQLADDDHVTECKRESNLISAKVKCEDGEQNVSFRLTSGRISSPSCECCTSEDLEEQWCDNMVAVFIKAQQLGLLDSLNQSGKLFLINNTSAEEVAKVINDLGTIDTKFHLTQKKKHDLQIGLNIKNDTIEVEILIDDQLQTPNNIDPSFSDRALENLLLEVVEEQAPWNENSHSWVIDNNSAARIVLGLIREFPNLYLLGSREKISFSKEVLDAYMQIEWKDSLVELSMWWKMPNNKVQLKKNSIFRSDVSWTIIDNTVYKLSEQANKISNLFTQTGTITLGKSQASHILEALIDELFDREHIIILNPEKQPKAEIKSPIPQLELERIDNRQDHFSSASNIELSGEFSFKYPEPPSNKNIIYVPNRELENEYRMQLASIGFSENSNRIKIRGNDALDLLYGSINLSDAWQISGLKDLKKSVKFVDLMLVIDLKTTKDLSYLDCNISLLQNSNSVPLSVLFKSNSDETAKWLRLDNGAYAKVPLVNMGALTTTLGMITSNYRFANTLSVKITQAQAISLARIDDPCVRIITDQEVKELAKKLRDFSGIKTVKTHKDFVGKLRPYQADGLSWLNFLHEFKLDGILADEMGLGKTVQTLALIQKLKSTKKIDKPSLIVAPTSVITNWSYECKRFTPDLKFALLHGPQRKNLLSKLNDYDVIITSYALLRIDRSELEKYQFSYIILDEAQNIKNPQAITSKSAKALKSERRLALSGTPTENRPLELWSIMDFLMPGYLGAIDFFRNQIERPIMEVGTQTQIAQFLNSKTRPFILRRLKQDVEKDLPPKIESELYVTMTSSQKQLYNQILEEVRPKVFDAVEKKGIGGASVSILAALLRLRQVCNHPNSIDSLKDLDGFDSGKFKLLQDLLTEALENNKKILLFSQFREMLSIIRNWLIENSINHLYLDGTTKNRQDLVDQFNSDSKIRLFLISLKAGGTGLNLTAADTVVIYDPWWNPAVEVQAIDRAHRIGQSKAVSVYRLITEDSIEQKIMDLKAKKSQLIDALINENGLSGIKLSKKDLESFFTPLALDKS